jgi:hypothetical protein
MIRIVSFGTRERQDTVIVVVISTVRCAAGDIPIHDVTTALTDKP